MPRLPSKQLKPEADLKKNLVKLLAEAIILGLTFRACFLWAPFEILAAMLVQEV